MRAGDIVTVDFGIPQGSEPGFSRPSIIVTAGLILEANPSTLHVVPITSNTGRRMSTEIELDMPDNSYVGMAQVHLCTVIGKSRIIDASPDPDNVGPAALSQIRSVLADLLDIA